MASSRPASGMLGGLTTFLRLAVLAPFIGLLGFLIWIDRLSQVPLTQADALVVFTGEPERIALGFRALANSHARRMLVTGTELSSGTDTAETMAQVERDYPSLFRCCVTFDPRAQTTLQNAKDAAHWARAHAVTSLILITADYHMPRALSEFGAVLPRARIVPHALVTASPKADRVFLDTPWLHRASQEYGKFIAAWVRRVLKWDLARQEGSPG